MKSTCKLGMASALLLMAGMPASAAEMARLNNGFSLRVERHEPREASTRLYLSSDPNNYVEVATGDIVGYEAIETPAVQAVAPAGPAVTAEPAQPIAQDALVSAASSRNNIDPDFITSVIRAESGFNPKAISPKGAQGLMQLMPETAAWLGVQDAMNPADNVEAGTRYLRDLLDHYHNDVLKALAAYNAGPQRVEQFKGVPPFRETRAYINRVVLDFNRKKIAQRNTEVSLYANRAVASNAKNAAPGAGNLARPVRVASGVGAEPSPSNFEVID